MLRPLTLAALTLIAACAGPRAGFHAGESVVQQNAAGVALSGYDAVSYFEADAPERGHVEFAAQYDGATFWFASEERRDRFVAAPERYAPAYGGWCAWAVAADGGSLVEVDPESFLVQDGRLLLFYDGLLADTRAMWLDGDMTGLADTANSNWHRLRATSQGPDAPQKAPSE